MPEPDASTRSLPGCRQTGFAGEICRGQVERKEFDRKEGYQFVDCDMHIMEPTDLFDRYLDPPFKPRITSAMQPVDGGSTGMRRWPLWFFDGTPTSNDGNVSQYNRIRGPLVGARGNKNVLFAVERGYDAEAQIIGMEMEGIDIAVLFPPPGCRFSPVTPRPQLDHAAGRRARPYVVRQRRDNPRTASGPRA